MRIWGELMYYKNIYKRLCAELLVNLKCDDQQIALIWDFEGKLNRAPLLCVPRFFKTIDEAFEYLRENPDTAQGYQGFTSFEESFLARYSNVAMLEQYEAKILEQHNKICPFCGRELAENNEP